MLIMAMVTWVYKWIYIIITMYYLTWMRSFYCVSVNTFRNFILNISLRLETESSQDLHNKAETHQQSPQVEPLTPLCWISLGTVFPIQEADQNELHGRILASCLPIRFGQCQAPAED